MKKILNYNSTFIYYIFETININNKINIPFLEDKGVIGKKYGIQGIPTIVVIDKFGIIQLIRVGYTKEEEDLVSDLSEIIDKLLLDK